MKGFLLIFDYCFQEIEKNSFAEWCEVHGNYYGTHYGKLFEIYQRNKVIH